MSIPYSSRSPGIVHLGAFHKNLANTWLRVKSDRRSCEPLAQVESLRLPLRLHRPPKPRREGPHTHVLLATGVPYTGPPNPSAFPTAHRFAQGRPSSTRACLSF